MNGDFELALTPKGNFLAHDIKTQEKQGWNWSYGTQTTSDSNALRVSFPSKLHFSLGVSLARYCYHNGLHSS